MKIVNIPSGQAYQLKPDTQLEVERPNLFFNDYGEQTLPVELPDTDVNRQLTGYADMGVNKNKPQTDIQCSIQDGAYFMACRQAILGAQRKESIPTSFYMNEGSFLSKMHKLSLREMFNDETIPNINTVDDGISFCKSLLSEYNENYACFPIRTNFNDALRWINRVEWMDENGDYALDNTYITPPEGYTIGLYNAFERIEHSGDHDVLLAPGYYISPFIRARYLLKRIFQYFGYALDETFFDTVQPFKDMVFVNNTMDSLVNGSILLVHLVPDCYCSDILDVFRKKFNCEFVPDENSQTVSIRFFKDLASDIAKHDLSKSLTAPLKMDYSKEWQRLKISSSDVQEYSDNNKDISSFDTMADLLASFPSAQQDVRDGAFYHVGYSNYENTEKIAAATMPYSDGGNLEEKEIEVPDAAISMLYEEIDDYLNQFTSQLYRYRNRIYLPFIGDAVALNSTIAYSSEDSSTLYSVSTSTNHDQKPMLCFVYAYKQGFTAGTTTSHDTDAIKLWDYSLHYYGKYGIFEKFYRSMDDMLRNSLKPVTATLLLDQVQKQNILAHDKILINGEEFLINILKYSLGGKNDPMESELLTVQLYDPVDRATIEADRFVSSPYRWDIRRNLELISKQYYDNLKIKNNALTAIYPLPPTEAQFNAGGLYYPRIFYRVEEGSGTYYKITVSLAPIISS